MFQYIAIFFLNIFLIVPTTQICCPSPSAISPVSSVNILIPVPYDFTFPGTDGLGGFPDSAYFGYFTQCIFLQV
ncbi:hypothetical protein X798_06332 [Onchocerca flexuosa]|uniref:Secreted protein n=1 Tax=Onchocerca flexuosa TaxID=387005 RepID=A0A238BP80_9BILA|nr:hypothetical protein X798_06332 [Onchocerca flexuosa]